MGWSCNIVLGLKIDTSKIIRTRTTRGCSHTYTSPFCPQCGAKGEIEEIDYSSEFRGYDICGDYDDNYKILKLESIHNDGCGGYQRIDITDQKVLHAIEKMKYDLSDLWKDENFGIWVYSSC